MSTSFPICVSQIIQAIDAPYPKLQQKITHNTSWKFNGKYKLSRLSPLFVYQNVICVLQYHSFPPWCISQAVWQYYLSDRSNGATLQRDRIMPISSTYFILCRPCYVICRIMSHCTTLQGSQLMQPLHRPGQVLWVTTEWGSQISRQTAHEGGKVVSLTYPLGNIPGTHFC